MSDFNHIRCWRTDMFAHKRCSQRELSAGASAASPAVTPNDHLMCRLRRGPASRRSWVIRMIRGSRAANIPLALIVWGAVGIALNVGLARFTYGVMLPWIRRDLGISYLGSGSLNAVHLAGYLVGTFAAPSLMSRMGSSRLSKWAHLLVATGAVLCAVAPGTIWAGSIVLGTGRVFTGLGAGVGIVAILVVVFSAVLADDARWRAQWFGPAWGCQSYSAGSPFVPARDGRWLADRVRALGAAGSSRGVLVCACARATRQTGGGSKQPRRGLRHSPVGNETLDVLDSRLPDVRHSVRRIFDLCGYPNGSHEGTDPRSRAYLGRIWMRGDPWRGADCADRGLVATEAVALAASLASGAVEAWVAGTGTSESAIIGALLVGLGIAATPTIVSASTAIAAASPITRRYSAWQRPRSASDN